jgi:hypothetical protein
MSQLDARFVRQGYWIDHAKGSVMGMYTPKCRVAWVGIDLPILFRTRICSGAREYNARFKVELTKS